MGFLRDLAAGRRVGTGVFLSGPLPHPMPLKMLSKIHSVGCLGLLPEPGPHALPSSQLQASFLCHLPAESLQGLGHTGPSRAPDFCPHFGRPLLFSSVRCFHHIAAIPCCCLLSLEFEPKEGRNINGPHDRTRQFACSQSLINIF